jgi:general stress protein YciG
MSEKGGEIVGEIRPKKQVSVEEAQEIAKKGGSAKVDADKGVVVIKHPPKKKS